MVDEIMITLPILETYAKEMYDIINDAEGILQHGVTLKGVCMCGDSMDKHHRVDHMPVDSYEYMTSSILGDIEDLKSNLIRMDKL